MKIKMKKSYKYLLLGIFSIFALLFILSFKTSPVKAADPYITLSSNADASNITWTSNLSNSLTSCTLVQTKFMSYQTDALMNKKNITPSGGSVSWKLGYLANNFYFLNIDCLVDGEPSYMIHSNEIRLGWNAGGMSEPSWAQKGNEPTATDYIRVFGGRNNETSVHDGLAPYGSTEFPERIAWYVRNYRGSVPNYDEPNDNEYTGATFTCSFTHPDGTKESMPEHIIDIYNIQHNFDAKIECENIRTLEVSGGAHGVPTFTKGSGSIFIKVKLNPQYNRVLATPVPPLVPFGGTAKINYKSNGDFCKITETPLLAPLQNGQFLNYSPNWGLTSNTGSGDFPVSPFEKQANFNVTCYTEHSCVGASSTNDSRCAVANTKNDCFNITEAPVKTSLCAWNEAPGSCKQSGPVPPFFPSCSAYGDRYACGDHPAYCTWELQGEANCTAIKPSNNNTCQAQKNSSDCVGIISSEPVNICNWGRVSGSTNGGNVGAKNPTTNFLGFAKAVVRIYNFSLSMMGNGYIVNTSTTEPEEIGDMTAVLTGEMNPNGQDTELREAKAYFRYTLVDTFPPIFCNDIFGSNMLATTEQPVGPANKIQRVTASVSNLYPNTTYYYCIVGSNNDQITYGGIKSFTTKMNAPDINGNPDPNFYSDKISVTTKSASVINDNSVYLKGSFNTEIAAMTWFEYQKVNSGPSIQNIGIEGNSPSASIFDFFFKPNIAIAAKATNDAYQIKKVFIKDRFPNTNGNFSFLLNGLSPSTTYQFRSVIKDTRFSNIKYGDTLSFTTKSSTSSGTRTKPPIGALPAEPLCKNKIDINCNGSGTLPGVDPETDPGDGTGLINLSDLTASDISASALIVNKPITLSVTIINQGSSSTSATIKNQRTDTGNGNTNNTTTTGTTGNVNDTTTTTGKTGGGLTTPPVKIIDNKKRVNPTSIPIKIKPSTNIKRVTPTELKEKDDLMNNVQQGGGASTSFLKDLFTTKKALAIITNNNSILSSGTKTTTGIVTNNNSADINRIGGVTSIINENRLPTGIATGIYSGTSIDGSFYNFFQVSTVNPNNVTSDLNNSFTNLSPIKTTELSPKTSRVLTQEYTFPKEGTYHIRACADKKNPADNGVIQESYEGNNCGQWTTFTIGNNLMCEDPKALNYGTRAPCVSKEGKCLNFSANNYGSPLPCTFTVIDDYIDNTNGTNDTTGTTGTNGTNTNGNYINTNGTNNNNTNIGNLKLGDKATPPDLAIVRYHEGIETVLQRQIVADTVLAKSYGYQDGADIQSFAWSLADILAKTFGYVGTNGKEIRVSKPDIAAYQLYMNNGILTVY
ncbi:MAG: hypothetical protein WCG45_02430, partial [bacterium]